MTNLPQFSELEFDALTELVNIGVGRAAVSLRQMIGEQVLLSVPKITMISRANAIELLTNQGVNKGVAVHQVFEGDIAGSALLIFPDKKSLELVRAVTGGSLSLEDLIELEQEALAETGNIILNGCMATIANLLQRSLRMSLPEVLRGEGSAFFDVALPPSSGEVVIFFYVDFAVKTQDIHGYIAMLMDLPSVTLLKGLLNDLIVRTTIPDAPCAVESNSLVSGN